MDMAKPIIRFKGYQDDWEQRKLGDIADVTKLAGFEFTEHVVYSDEGNVIALRGLNIKNGQLILDDVKYIDGSNFSKLSRSKLFIDDIMFTYVGTVGEVAIIKENDRFYLAPNVSRIRVKSDDSPKFISHYMRTDNFKNKVIFPLIATSSQPALSMENIRKFTINIPTSREEQDCLAKYFDNLDHLITLHQRKCDETKKLKKYMLQKMFPQNGEKVPEIRFSGFTDDWEQRKLEDIAEFSKGSGYSKGDLIESGTPIILYGRLYTKYETSISEVDTYVEAKDGSVYSKGGEVIVPASGETAEDIARAATVDKSGVILGGDLNVVSPNEDINSAFLAISISHGNSQRELAKKAQGKSVVHIHNEEIKNLVVPFPANAEQNKIVEYFSNLDHLITLHQRELESLQNIKKFMLEKMFV